MCSRRVHTIPSHNCVFNTGLCHICYTQPVNWLSIILSQLTSSTFHLTFSRIREKRSSSMICQSRVFHEENSAHIFCIMMHLKVNDQLDDYKSSHCCCRLNITCITINTYFLPGQMLIISNLMRLFLFSSGPNSSPKRNGLCQKST